METEGQTLHVGEQVPPQVEDKVLADVTNKTGIAVSGYASNDRDEEHRCATAVHDLHAREMRGVQPLVDQRYAAWFMGKHTIDHHFERPRTQHAEHGVQNHA